MADKHDQSAASDSRNGRDPEKSSKADTDTPEDVELSASLKADLRRGGRAGAQARADAADYRARARRLEAAKRVGGKRAEEVRGHEREQRRAAKRAKKYSGRQDPRTR